MSELDDYLGPRREEEVEPEPIQIHDKPWEEWPTFERGPKLQLPLRTRLKMDLMRESSGNLACPFCEHRTGRPTVLKRTASQMHEIFAPRMRGGKYDPKSYDPVAQAVYVMENLILACPTCNVNWLNGQDRAWVFMIKLGMPGYSAARCIPKILDIAKTVMYPDGYVEGMLPKGDSIVPRTLFGPGGEEYRIDMKTFTYSTQGATL